MRNAVAGAVSLVLLLLVLPDVAAAHSGGLDSNGGHYCREAGYESGACAPLNSYQCHQPGCVDYDGSTGNGGGGGDDGDGGGGGSAWETYEPAPSGVTGEKMRARRMLGLLRQAREPGGDAYERSKFPHWADLNGDGCNTRQAVLISESRVKVDRLANCDVIAGRWKSVYDGRVWNDPSDVDIDHVVALREAWVSGARDWSRGRRREYANDLRFRGSLRAVTDNVNQSKGAQDPGDWLPEESRCTYAVNWVQVKYRWRLQANGDELDALDRIIRGDCADRRVAVPKRPG